MEGTVVTADTVWAGKGSSQALGQLPGAHGFLLALLFRQDSDEDPAKTGCGKTQIHNCFPTLTSHLGTVGTA